MHEGLVKILEKQDGWQNILTGAGLTKDKLVNTKYSNITVLNEKTLSDIYRGDGLGTRIIDVPANDMLRGWISVEGDSDNITVKTLNKLKLRASFTKALKWSRLYGGSLIVMGIDDGRISGNGKNILALPIRENNIRKFLFFRVYDKRQVTWSDEDLDYDVSSMNYGQPKYFTINDRFGTGVGYKVHYSRCLKFDGKPLPEDETRQNQGWGDSILQSVYERMQGFANALIATGAILDDFVIGILNIKGLSDLIANGRDEAVLKRLNMMDQSKHVLNTILLDEEETFQRLAAQVNGIKDILEFFKDTLSAYCGIPQIKLFGEQSKGLGAQAAGNIRLYYDDIAQDQEDYLRPHFDKVLGYLYKTEEFRNIKTNEWTMEFNNIWQKDDKEESEIRLNMAKADDLYINNGTLSPATVAKSRFGNETYSVDTILGDDNDSFNKKMTEKLSTEPKKQEPSAKKEEK